MSDPADGLECWAVGGAVRDALLGVENSDIDWVVVGSTPEEMIRRGFRPVGSEFPVFLHPLTGEEYALARTERKLGPGHTGFECISDPSVTLEEDLGRRDFTVNAMARSPDGTIVDPFGGRADLDSGVLRHISGAFTEDPLRVLRAARLAAQLGFELAPETRQLLRRMADSGELRTLTAERIWQELFKAHASDRPAVFWAVLREVGALPEVFPELAGGDWSRRLGALAAACPRGGAELRIAALLSALPDGEALLARLRAPKRLLDAVRFASELRRRDLARLDAGDWQRVLQRVDVYRRPERLAFVLEILAACGQVDAHQQARIAGLVERLRKIDTTALRAAGLTGAELGAAIDAARLAAIEDWLGEVR